jgi:hypothetical protein
MPHRRDAVVRIVRESTRLVSGRRRFRDGVRATQAANKFMCPCHGSQYDETGKVVRGPAPLSLALAHITDNAGVVTFTPWTETDFRTGLNPCFGSSVVPGRDDVRSSVPVSKSRTGPLLE